MKLIKVLAVAVPGKIFTCKSVVNLENLYSDIVKIKNNFSPFN